MQYPFNRPNALKFFFGSYNIYIYSYELFLPCSYIHLCVIIFNTCWPSLQTETRTKFTLQLYHCFLSIPSKIDRNLVKPVESVFYNDTLAIHSTSFGMMLMLNSLLFFNSLILIFELFNFAACMLAWLSGLHKYVQCSLWFDSVPFIAFPNWVPWIFILFPLHIWWEMNAAKLRHQNFCFHSPI